jgi:hypothetical protein
MGTNPSCSCGFSADAGRRHVRLRSVDLASTASYCQIDSSLIAHSRSILPEDSDHQSLLCVSMTVFGPPWDQLRLEDLAAFLRDAPSEPLNWEIKGNLNAGSLRKAVCGFANGHDDGYLIIGAKEQAGSWALDGTTFTGQDPPAAITDLLVNGGVQPYPDGLDVQPFDLGNGKHVAVLRIPPVATPPSMTKGTVYERVAGQTIPVTDPTRLASLFERGDAARQAGVAKAEQIAAQVLRTASAGPENVQFGFGLAAPGFPLDLTPRLFVPSFSADAEARIRAVLADDARRLPPGEARISRSVTQFELIYKVEATDRRLGFDWLVQVSRLGAVGVHWTTGAQHSRIDSIVGSLGSPLGRAWRFGDGALTALGVHSPRYLHMIVGAPFPPAALPKIARGGVFGPTEDALASIERELRRASGEVIFEDEQ